MVALVTCNRGPGKRTHFAVDGPGVIPLLLECDLNAGHDLVGRKTVGTVNRFVVLIIRVGIVTPGRIPPAVIPTPPTEIEEDDGDAMMVPPPRVVMMITIVKVVQMRLRDAADVPVPIPKTVGGLWVESVFAANV